MTSAGFGVRQNLDRLGYLKLGMLFSRIGLSMANRLALRFRCLTEMRLVYSSRIWM